MHFSHSSTRFPQFKIFDWYSDSLGGTSSDFVQKLRGQKIFQGKIIGPLAYPHNYNTMILIL